MRLRSLLLCFFAMHAFVACAPLRRWRHRSKGAARVERPVRIPELFASTARGPLVPGNSLANAGMYGPFFTAVDGQMAVLAPAGTMRVVSARRGEPRVDVLSSPCRFDASRHLVHWTIPTRVAISGTGLACCVHDGDEEHSAGAYCVSLQNSQRNWRRVEVPWRVVGVGSGAGAVAVFGTDLVCTSDGVRTFGAQRGDPSQPLSSASCGADGTMAAAGGTRGLGAVREQSLRATPRGGGALVAVEGAPHGEPVDVRVRPDGSVWSFFVTNQGQIWIDRPANGATRTRTLNIAGVAALGEWNGNVLVGAGTRVLAITGAGVERMRELPDGHAMTELAVVSRVGTRLVGIGRDGAVLQLGIE